MVLIHYVIFLPTLFKLLCNVETWLKFLTIFTSKNGGRGVKDIMAHGLYLCVVTDNVPKVSSLKH